MSQQYSVAEAKWTTVSPTILSALNIGDVSAIDFRPPMWWGRPDEIFEQRMENDTAFLAFLESGLIDQQFDMTQPIFKWRCGRPADLWTTNAKAIATTDTYISLVDPLVAPTGFTLQFTDYGVSYRVIDHNTDLSKGWVNDAADACNTRVERLTGPTVAIPVGYTAQSGAPLMSELGTPHRGITSTPGDPIWNNISMVGIYGSTSRLQMESEMVGGWGTHGRVREDIHYQHRIRKQSSTIWDYRYTGTDSQVANSQLYQSAGIVPQIKTNVMEAGSLGVNLDPVKTNDFLENLFNSELSSASKQGFVGSALFRDLRLSMAQINEVEVLGVQSGADNPMSLGSASFVITLQSGKQVTINELRKAFGSDNLTDWGFVLDAANVGVGAYRNLKEVWFDDIEVPAQQITLKSDALVDTWTVALKDESTCGVFRGGTRGLVDRG